MPNVINPVPHARLLNTQLTLGMMASSSHVLNARMENTEQGQPLYEGPYLKSACMKACTRHAGDITVYITHAKLRYQSMHQLTLE